MTDPDYETIAFGLTAFGVFVAGVVVGFALSAWMF